MAAYFPCPAGTTEPGIESHGTTWDQQLVAWPGLACVWLLWSLRYLRRGAAIDLCAGVGPVYLFAKQAKLDERGTNDWASGFPGCPVAHDHESCLARLFDFDRPNPVVDPATPYDDCHYCVSDTADTRGAIRASTETKCGFFR